MLKKIRQSMAYKLILTNCLVLVAVFFIAYVLIWMQTRELTIEKESQALRAYLVNSLSSLDDRLKDLGRATMIPVADSRVQQILIESDTYSERQSVDAMDYMQRLFLSMITSRTDISAMYLFNNTDIVSKYTLLYISLRAGFSIETDPWFLENLENTSVLSNGTRLMSGSIRSVIVSPTHHNVPFNNEYLTVMREINSFSPHERIGYMMVVTRMSAIDQILKKAIGVGERYILVDSHGDILCESDGVNFYTPLTNHYPELAQISSGELTELRLNDEPSIALSVKSSFSGLTLYVIKPEALVYNEAWITMLRIILISTTAVLLVIAITSLWIRRIVHPITELAGAMASFSRTNTRPSVTGAAEDEIKRLGDAFNTMLDEINELIILEYEKTIQLQQTQLRQKEAEFMVLQNQINPHFLYNTLDNIRIKASLNGDDEVAGLIVKLVAFFRYSMAGSGTQATLRREIGLMRVYLQLMQYRYPLLDDEYNLDEALMDAVVPGFILQPLVENSLTHGLKAIHYHGKLTLSMRSDTEKQDDILITLSDNGIGASEAILAQLNAYTHTEEETDEARSHVGVRNVQERLFMTYGEGYGLRYLRNESGGVTVIIRVRDLSNQYDGGGRDS